MNDLSVSATIKPRQKTKGGRLHDLHLERREGIMPPPFIKEFEGCFCESPTEVPAEIIPPPSPAPQRNHKEIKYWLPDPFGEPIFGMNPYEHHPDWALPPEQIRIKRDPSCDSPHRVKQNERKVSIQIKERPRWRGGGTKEYTRQVKLNSPVKTWEKEYFLQDNKHRYSEPKYFNMLLPVRNLLRAREKAHYMNRDPAKLEVLNNLVGVLKLHLARPKLARLIIPDFQPDSREVTKRSLSLVFKDREQHFCESPEDIENTNEAAKKKQVGENANEAMHSSFDAHDDLTQVERQLSVQTKNYWFFGKEQYIRNIELNGDITE
ncbi:hypothetical protein BDQ12DRAFT_727035 [Crucibulum laeve]|uniref:Uncharacterized protein n=1 Tax=Crucibulum laeve TaxID=68775 RepID=A0A5C3LNE1_9AGAR|nr:hypothetical protein BDQ12DRAFT_727035 [Crucibulum laeve]